MRFIHLLIGTADPNTANGVNRVVDSLATAQAEAGIAVEVWGVSNRPPSAAGRRSYPLLLFRRKRSRFLLAEELVSAIEKLGREDWVQLHSVFVPELITVAKLLRERGIRYGATPHGALAQPAFEKNYVRKRLFFRCFEENRMRQAALVQAISNQERAILMHLLPGKEVTIIPNGCDVRHFTFAQAYAARHQPVFGYVGRFTILQKGLDLMLAGFAEYVKTGGGGSLWLIGEGKDECRLREMAKESEVTERVIFHGAKYGAEKDRFLLSMDAFLHTSRWEGLPTACMEAASMRRPLIVTLETGMQEYVQRYRCGICLADSRPPTIARALHEFSEQRYSGTTVRWGDRAAEMIEHELNWPHVARLFEQEISRVQASAASG